MTAEDSVDELIDALVRCTFQVTGVLTRIGADNDMSLTQLRVFGILRDRRLRVTDLAAYLGLDKSTMSGLIDRAERRGLLARAKNPSDGRVVEVFMTPLGHSLTQRLDGEVRAALTPDLARLHPTQRTQLLTLLQPLLPAE
ncbi:MarR family transcriptional regulator [Actinoplanes sp. NPDC026670]|jgi:DNA-binding MarR family transcriptional regulator|uniref:MarR family winged helix-turn-helix transcriptional regulator n=1 Tax=Actinoplanes sp. NPDC026670 TaxID=3154700 RepID=UPI0033F16367